MVLRSSSGFGSNSPETTDHLIGATTGATVLGSHAYLRPPTTLASDLASDLRDTDDVPAGVKRQFVPADDSTRAALARLT